MLAMPYVQCKRTTIVKAQRILNDHTEFLNQQLPQHQKEIEVIKVKMSAQFPAAISGPS